MLLFSLLGKVARRLYDREGGLKTSDCFHSFKFQIKRMFGLIERQIIARNQFFRTKSNKIEESYEFYDNYLGIR